ncbi:hypothetical protein ALC56_05629 [Trachymyrmex septentrionalis]|uniref:Uncharacterized protein n=1 Tax=Trachymyrmex septentrionalis TaxID=34720 RepID=A0A195FHK5_9HYME|nr:hypothetical protein ALC56_05629 [Trachymyrmex septentrionalis]
MQYARTVVGGWLENGCQPNCGGGTGRKTGAETPDAAPGAGCPRLGTMTGRREREKWELPLLPNVGGEVRDGVSISPTERQSQCRPQLRRSSRFVLATISSVGRIIHRRAYRCCLFFKYGFCFLLWIAFSSLNNSCVLHNKL